VIKNLLTEHFPKYTTIMVRAVRTPILIFIVIVGNSILLGASLIFYYFEKDLNPSVTHFGDALFWAITTITTVGYGDIVPMTALGRVVAATLMVSGVFLFFMFGGILASILYAVTAETIVGAERILSKNEIRILSEKIDELGAQIRSIRKEKDD
jgi:voltage-gated potassium channel